MKKERWTLLLVVLGLVMVASAPVTGDDGGGYFTLSVQLEQSGKLVDSLDALNKIQDDRSDSYMVTLRKGWLLYSLGRYEESVVQYRKAIKARPESLEARLGVMLPLLAWKKWVDVEKVGLEALALDGKNYLAHSRLAYAYYNLERWSKAEEHYKAVVDLYPGDVEMRSGYGWSLFKQGKFEAARTQFKEILQLFPAHSASLEGLRLCP